MSPLRAAALLCCLSFAAAFGCGESRSDDDAVTPESGCAKDSDCPSDVPKCTQAGECVASNRCNTDADCSGEAPKCTQAGQCVGSNRCDTDADCRGDYPFCDALDNCEPCREDADCPSQTPICAQSWEGGVYCAPCRVGDTSTCPPGSYCTSAIASSAQTGGSCQVPDCDRNPTGTSCTACVNENAQLCTEGDGQCVMAKDALVACYQKELPGWMEGDCPIEVPAFRGCTPMNCQAPANGYDSCLLKCPSVLARCSSSPSSP